MRLLTIFIIISLFFSSCKKEFIDGFEKYTILEGRHSSTKQVSFLQSDELSFEVIFDESAIYTSQIPINQLDLNKLYGFSECSEHHQKNSARFGWRWNDDKLQIFAYVYNETNLSYKHIKDVEINKVHKYTIIIQNKSYVFMVDGEEVHMDRTNACNVGLYYMLYPYFGGDEVAPHDIKILIKQKYIR